MSSYYAVAKGYNIGIYKTWNECKKQTNGFKGAIFKKFDDETSAENYILHCNNVHCYIHEQKYNKFGDEEIDYYVYTDGSCLNNGKNNPVSGIGIYFGDNSNKNVSQICNVNTNNAAELFAIITCYCIIRNDLVSKKICIFTDSEYSIKAATSFGEKCAYSNWELNIPNIDLVKKLYYIYINSPNLILKHIKAHTTNNDIHSIGNRKADKLAYNAIKSI